MEEKPKETPKETKEENRWETIQDVWKDNEWLVVIAGWIWGALTVLAVEAFREDALDFLLDLVPEGMGILFTFFVIDALVARRQRKQLQVRLVREAVGQSSEMGQTAVDWMQHEKWLKGKNSLLSGIKASRANLQGVDLARANISGTDFYKSKFNGANLYKTNSKNTNFAWADLTEVDFIQADLTGANLEGAILDGVKFDHPNREATILPDGQQWTEDTDMKRFTHHTHPDFWRSKDEASFAHRSKDEIWARQRINPDDVQIQNYELE